MGTIGQLRLEPGIPVIVTNSSLKNLTSAVQQLRQAGIPVILSGVDGAQFGSDICSVASDSALAMTQMVRYLLSYDRKRIALAGFWSSSRNDMAFLDAAVAAADRFGYPISPQSIFLWENQLDESLNAFFQKYEDYNAVIWPQRHHRHLPDAGVPGAGHPDTGNALCYRRKQYADQSEV